MQTPYFSRMPSLLQYKAQSDFFFYSFSSICTVINIINNVIHSMVNLKFNLFFPFPVLLHRLGILTSYLDCSCYDDF